MGEGEQSFDNSKSGRKKIFFSFIFPPSDFYWEEGKLENQKIKKASPYRFAKFSKIQTCHKWPLLPHTCLVFCNTEPSSA